MRTCQLLLLVLVVLAGASPAVLGKGVAPAATPSARYAVWPADGMTKVGRTQAPPAKAPRGVTISAARNEYESAQVVISAGATPVTTAAVTVGSLVGPNKAVLGPGNISLYRVAYHYLPYYQRWAPDALPPLGTFSIAANTNQPVWITVHIPKGTAAGDYHGTIRVTASGYPDTQVPITVTVWGFTLPDTPTSHTGFGWFGSPNGSPETVRTNEAYWEALLEHRISPYGIPTCRLCDAEAGKYLGDPRVTGFMLPYFDTAAWMKTIVDEMRAGGWLSKGYFYPLDEPTTRDQYDTLIQRANVVHSVDPSLKVVTPLRLGPDFAPPEAVYTLLDGYVDIWVPMLQMYDEAQARAKQAQGDDVWWYVCCLPQEPYPNLFLHEDAIDPRLLLWMQKYYGVQGLLYWSVNAWDPYLNVWDRTVPRCTDGDGYLFYPGTKLGITAPIGSIRLECLRDGLEDFDYLTLLEQKIGSAQMKAYIARLVRSRTDYEKDPAKLLAVRREIATILSAP